MDVNLLWQAILIIIIGIILIRISGRRSISQMTISQTVIMIAIGTLLIQPIASKNLLTTFILGFTLIITLNVIEYIQMKWDFTEALFTGRSKIIVENGQLNEKSLAKLKLSVDKLEMRLRQNGIENISDLKWATLEPSGQLGYSLKENKRYATKEDLDNIQTALEKLFIQLDPNIKLTKQKNYQPESTIFSEIKHGHKKKLDEHLK